MTRLDDLARFNRIVGDVFSLDQSLRVIAYSGLLVIDTMKRMGYGSHPLALSLTDMYTRVSDARFINRVFGIPASLEGLLAPMGTDTTQAFLGKAMSASMCLAYYPLEHAWLISTFKPKMLNIDSDLWSRVSCQAWGIYIILDAIGTLLRMRKASDALKKLAKEEETKETAREKARVGNEIYWLKLWMSVIFCDFAMAAHWSVKNGPLNDLQIALVGIWGGATGLYLKWLRSKAQIG